jgi:peptidyl-prolyl cis-trans isomerase SurA
MTRNLIFGMAISSALAAGVVVDRLAVIVGKHAVKLSDIDRDLRVTGFLNRQPLDLGPAARRKAAERLIDQQLIRDEMTNMGYNQEDAGGGDLLDRIRRSRFAGSDARLRQALAPYGLTEDELRAQLSWQAKVLSFIDQRFRPGVMVTDDEVRAYYDQYRAELARLYPRTPTLDDLDPKIREIIEAQRVNQNFEAWLGRARQRTRIEFLQEAFK